MKVASQVSSRSGWCAGLVLVVALAAASRSEHQLEPHLTSVGSISWDGNAFVAAWEHEDRDAVTVYLRRFDTLKTGVTTIRGGAVAHYRKYGLPWHSPELISDDAGALVVVNPGPGQQLVVPIDRQGRTGAPQMLTGCKSADSQRVCYVLCRRGVAHRDGFVVGHVSGYNVSGLNSVQLSFVDRAGTTQKVVWSSSEDPHSCALTKLGTAVIVASTARDSVLVQFYDISTTARSGELRLEDGTAAIGSVTIGDEVALLYGTRTGVRIARIGREGLRGSVELASDVDPTTADIGADSRGVFVTWLRGGKLHVRRVGASRDAAVQRAGRDAIGTRALGVGDRCIATWMSGSKLKLLATADCR